MINREHEQFMSLGFQIGNLIERRLGVQHATFVHPQDLAMIGLAVFGGEGQDHKLLYLNPRRHARNVVSDYRAETLQRVGVSPRQLETQYPELTGNGDYSKGRVANALRRADQAFNEDELLEFQHSLAQLMARYAKIKPEAIGEPNVRLDPIRGSVRFARGLEYALSSPANIVVEYGPGAVGLKKVASEVRLTPQTIFIENNYYVNQLLFSGAQLHGVSYPQVITRMDGIKAATEEFLAMGAASGIDMVIMSMVHSAGEEEAQTGVENARRLLRPGGLFVVQAAEQVQPGEAAGKFIKDAITATFPQAPAAYKEYRYTDPVRRAPRDVFQGVYVK